MVLLSGHGMPVAKIAEVAFTSEDHVRDVIHNFNTDGFAALYPKYKGGRPKKFTLRERREITKIAKSTPGEHDLPFSTWSLSKLAEFLVAEGVVEDISHEGLRTLLRAEGVSFQRIKTFKHSRDPDYAAKKARVEQLYALADGEASRGPGDPDVVVCLDEFGPLNLQPRPVRQPHLGHGPSMTWANMLSLAGRVGYLRPREDHAPTCPKGSEGASGSQSCHYRWYQDRLRCCSLDKHMGIRWLLPRVVPSRARSVAGQTPKCGCRTSRTRWRSSCGVRRAPPDCGQKSRDDVL
jgi:transposase